MVNEPLYSLRMRAAEGGSHEQGGTHISGGERLVTKSEIQYVVSQLVDKALTHSRGDADFIHVTIEKVDMDRVEVALPLSISTEEVENVEDGWDVACQKLRELQISEIAIQRALSILKHSLNLRGAVLLDSESGERLDERGLKGVRVSRMDWDHDGYRQWQTDYPSFSSSRIAEAIALATKVAYSPETVAEICWSDDPEYVTGYVASRELGYCRITQLKKPGDFAGGRVFFIKKGTDIDRYITYLEKTPILIG